MSFSLQQARGWVIQHKWAVALAVAVVFGYTFGKDIALRDNAADDAARQDIAGETQ